MRSITCLRFCAAALVMTVIWMGTAAAHRLDLFVSADGAVIQGEAVYTPGGPARRGTVTLSLPDGSELGTVEIEPDGTFSFQTPVRADIEVRIETPDAHFARATLPATELPTGLPDWQGDGATPNETAPTTDAPAAAVGQEDLLPVIEQAVSRQVTPLRQEIAALERSVRMRDILGGFGYIAGLAGVLLYFKTRRPAAP